MKRIMVFFVLICFVTLQGVALAASFQNDPDGFRGIKWGQDIATVQNQMKAVTKESDGEGISEYVKKSENLTLNDANLKKITYRFWQGKFMGVKLETEKWSDYLALRTAVFSQFGPGFQAAPYIEQYTWEGTSSNISLEWRTKGIGIFEINSAALYKKYQDGKNSATGDSQKAIQGPRGGF